MRFAFPSLIALVCFQGAEARDLRVCADPNNMPFSSEARQGFENRLSDIIGEELDAQVVYHWRAQRRGFLRESLKAGLCDVVPGVPVQLEGVAHTRPYYRSSYVFVTRGADAQISSFDDNALRGLSIGVQLVGDDGWNTPPAHALARRGLISNIRGFTLYGDYTQPDPPARIIEAVRSGEIDVAVAWGPMAGFFALRANPALQVTQIERAFDGPNLPMQWDIGMAVRKDDAALRDELDAALTRRKGDIEALLSEYSVPQVRRDSLAEAP